MHGVALIIRVMPPVSGTVRSPESIPRAYGSTYAVRRTDLGRTMGASETAGRRLRVRLITPLAPPLVAREALRTRT